MRRLAPAAAVAALLVALLAGCSAGSSSSDSSSPGGVAGQPAPDAPVQEGPADLDGESGQSDDAADAGDQADREVVTTGWMSVTVDDPIASAEDAADATAAAGGRVDHRSETPGTDTQPASADLTLRIPSAKLEDVIAELRGYGTVNSISLDATDVTGQTEDLDARIEALEASIDRLTTLLGQATTTTDLIAIESEITTRQAELDSLTAQRDHLADQVAYSTLTLQLVTEGVAPEPAPASFWDGFIAGWTALVAFASGLLVVIGALLPWLLALAVIGAIVLVIVWLATRRRRGTGHGGGAADGAGAGAGAAAPGGATGTDAPPPPSA
ncbi:DUF4349 domain-containing protein [Agromyces sp. MMS24-K17]|uniref:DUF4349 domain-containing protein n=1 Tax=Agromyces sp. MMS24-K17 TaxID=3372850 RepID=UPI003754E4C6